MEMQAQPVANGSHEKAKRSRFQTGLAWLAASVCLAWTGLQVNAAGPVAIQNATIIPIHGERIEGGTILIRDGKIIAVGQEVTIPAEARVINAAGKVVMPGFVDPHNSAAMSQANERNEVVPFLSVVDSIDPVANYFEECRRNGITTAAVVPGNSTLIGGQAAILKTAGQYVNDMLLSREAGLKISLRPSSGSRMSQMARLRQELDKARRALEKEKTEKPAEDTAADKAAEEAPQTGSDSESSDESEESSDGEKTDAAAANEDQGLAALGQALQGKLPVFIYCENGMDVIAALKLVKDYGLQPILVLGRDCHQAASQLAELELPVILDPTLVFWETNERTREDEKFELPKIYRDAGVPFVFQIDDSGSRTTLGSSYFWFQAATAVKYGMPESEALEALTLLPAKLLGIDDMVGSIEVGKDADLIVLSGEPLDVTTWVEQTIIAGEVVYDRSQDDKLERLLSPSAE